MGECQQEHFGVLILLKSGMDGIAEVSFDHREDRFDLPSFPVGSVVELESHESAIEFMRYAF
jgi:hypothetical protein